MEPANEPPSIAGPSAHPRKPRASPPPNAWDAHAHIFGPADKFPYAPGRGYTPADAPVERYVALLAHLGLARGLLVQGNAHGYDNGALLDALVRYPRRLRGVAITDTRIKPETLRDWHRIGMRGLRFHLFSKAGRPGYVRGVGLKVFDAFRPMMRELGWAMQIFCDWRLMGGLATTLRGISREMPVIVDHMLHIPAARSVDDADFQALLRLAGEGHVYVKVSAPYRLSTQFPDYPDARPFHDALLRANPERLMWGTDWPHPSIPGEIMPDDGHLLDLFYEWTVDAATRRKTLVETPDTLFAA
jgi:predicted TIM-barrel fold metal-dependent hydrolase